MPSANPRSWAKPAHNRAAAGGVHARARRSPERQGDDQDGEGRCEGRDEEAGAAAREPDGEYEPFSHAVSQKTPSQQCEDRARIGSRDREPDLCQVEVVLSLERRREHRNAEKDRRIGGLRARPEREDRPAVPTHRSEPNGAGLLPLDGRGRLGGEVERDPVHAGDLVDDAARDRL